MEKGEEYEYDRDSLFSDYSDNHFRKSRSKSKSRSRERDRDRDREDKKYKGEKSEEVEDKHFVMKNGCCRDCMRAFSKTGKSCLCQVPKHERKYTLPDKGCNFCGCHGCNPVDVRRERRKDIKKQLREDSKLQLKKQRLIDSDDENLNVGYGDIDEFNRKRKDFYEFLSRYLSCSPNFVGIGAPLRTPSYILGYNPNYSDDDKKKRKRSNQNNHGQD